MTPPSFVCPRGPHGPGPSCPLWSARAKLQVQKSVQADSAAHLGMTALVFADAANRGFQRPSIPPTRPIPVEPRPLAELVETTATGKPVSTKGVQNDV
jgi:hypothetical protein